MYIQRPTKMIVRLSTILVFVFCTLTGCNKNTQIEIILNRADSLMNFHSDSALKIIKDINPDHIYRSATFARYSLLYSQALDKNYIDVTSDSLIRYAVKYYSKKGNAYQKATSYYYLGRIHCNAKEINLGIKALSEAESYAVKTNNYYLCGLIYNTLGNQYYEQGSFDKAITMYHKSADYFGKDGDISRKANALSYIAKAYFLQKNDYSAIKYHTQAKELYLSINDYQMALLMNSAIAGKLINMKDVWQAAAILTEGYKKYNNHIIPDRDYPSWVEIYLQMKEYKKAKECALYAIGRKFATNRVKAGLYLLLCEIEVKTNNYKKAYEYSNLYSDCKLCIYQENKDQMIEEIKEKYTKEKLQASYSALEKEHRYIFTIYSLIILLIMVCGAFIILRILSSRKHMEENYNYEINKTKAYIESLQDDFSNLNNKYKSLRISSDNDEQTLRFLSAFEHRLNLMKEIMESAYTSESNPAHFYNKFKEYINISSKTEDAFSDLQYIVNKKFWGIIDHLKANYPLLTKSDLDFFSMLCFGFSTNAVRLIYGHTNLDSVFTKRKKLREKLGLSTNIQIETFIKNLKKELYEARYGANTLNQQG